LEAGNSLTSSSKEDQTERIRQELMNKFQQQMDVERKAIFDELKQKFDNQV
jgi:hypothetical protein